MVHSNGSLNFEERGEQAMNQDSFLWWKRGSNSSPTSDERNQRIIPSRDEETKEKKLSGKGGKTTKTTLRRTGTTPVGASNVPNFAGSGQVVPKARRGAESRTQTPMEIRSNSMKEGRRVQRPSIGGPALAGQNSRTTKKGTERRHTDENDVTEDRNFRKPTFSSSSKMRTYGRGRRPEAMRGDSDVGIADGTSRWQHDFKAYYEEQRTNMEVEHAKAIREQQDDSRQQLARLERKHKQVIQTLEKDHATRLEELLRSKDRLQKENQYLDRLLKESTKHEEELSQHVSFMMETIEDQKNRLALGELQVAEAGESNGFRESSKNSSNDESFANAQMERKHHFAIMDRVEKQEELNSKFMRSSRSRESHRITSSKVSIETEDEVRAGAHSSTETSEAGLGASTSQVSDSDAFTVRYEELLVERTGNLSEIRRLNELIHAAESRYERAEEYLYDERRKFELHLEQTATGMGQLKFDLDEAANRLHIKTVEANSTLEENLELEKRLKRITTYLNTAGRTVTQLIAGSFETDEYHIAYQFRTGMTEANEITVKGAFQSLLDLSLVCKHQVHLQNREIDAIKQRVADLHEDMDHAAAQHHLLSLRERSDARTKILKTRQRQHGIEEEEELFLESFDAAVRERNPKKATVSFYSLMHKFQDRKEEFMHNDITLGQLRAELLQIPYMISAIEIDDEQAKDLTVQANEEAEVVAIRSEIAALTGGHNQLEILTAGDKQRGRSISLESPTPSDFQSLSTENSRLQNTIKGLEADVYFVSRENADSKSLISSQAQSLYALRANVAELEQALRLARAIGNWAKAILWIWRKKALTYEVMNTDLLQKVKRWQYWNHCFEQETGLDFNSDTDSLDDHEPDRESENDSDVLCNEKERLRKKALSLGEELGDGLQMLEELRKQLDRLNRDLDKDTNRPSTLEIARQKEYTADEKPRSSFIPRWTSWRIKLSKSGLIPFQLNRETEEAASIEEVRELKESERIEELEAALSIEKTGEVPRSAPREKSESVKGGLGSLISAQGSRDAVKPRPGIIEKHIVIERPVEKIIEKRIQVAVPITDPAVYDTLLRARTARLSEQVSTLARALIDATRQHLIDHPTDMPTFLTVLEAERVLAEMSLQHQEQERQQNSSKEPTFSSLRKELRLLRPERFLLFVVLLAVFGSCALSLVLLRATQAERRLWLDANRSTWSAINSHRANLRSNQYSPGPGVLGLRLARLIGFEFGSLG